MIGNDVIDLALARKESDWKRKGFLDKIFTANEQTMILHSENPEITVWSLWSRKEAVYKIHNRNSGFRGFIPLKIECLENGEVVCDGNLYFTSTFISEEKVETLAVLEHKHLNQICYLQNKNEVVKTNGIPCLKNSFKPVSISHHGRFEQIVTLEN